MSDDIDCMNGTTVTISFGQYQKLIDALNVAQHIALENEAKLRKALKHLDEYFIYDTQAEVSDAYALIEEVLK